MAFRTCRNLYWNGQYVHAPHTGDVVKVSSGVGKFTCGLRYQ